MIEFKVMDEIIVIINYVSEIKSARTAFVASFKFVKFRTKS
jgi:hypothetical protein